MVQRFINSNEKRGKNTMKSIGIIGTGSSIGERIVTNKELEDLYQTSDAWIQEHLGIQSRAKSDLGTSTTDLALEASKKALDMAGLKPKDIDLIILATCTPDHMAPASALLLQHKLRAGKAAVFDMKAQCAGFVHLITVASQMARAGYKNVLAVASEALLKMMDPEDRLCNALFGDGASAVILSEIDSDSHGILSHHLGANPMFYEQTIVPAGGTASPLTLEAFNNRDHYLKFRLASSKNEGDDIASQTEMKTWQWSFACSALVDSLEISLKKIHCSFDDIDFLLPHPGHIKALNLILSQMNIPKEKCHVTFDKYGNTSGPQIGISLDEAVRSGRIKTDDLIGMTAIGMGMQWGSVVLRWHL